MLTNNSANDVIGNKEFTDSDGNLDTTSPEYKGTAQVAFELIAGNPDAPVVVTRLPLRS